MQPFIGAILSAEILRHLPHGSVTVTGEAKDGGGMKRRSERFSRPKQMAFSGPRSF